MTQLLTVIVNAVFSSFGATLDLVGKIAGGTGRLIGNMLTIGIIGFLCAVSYVAFTLRLDLWHQSGTALLTPLFVFMALFGSSSLLVLKTRGRIASGITIGAMAYITINIGGSFIGNQLRENFPKTVEGASIKKELFDAGNFKAARASAVEVKTPIPCTRPRADYFGEDQLTGRRVTNIGYTRGLNAELRCFDIRLNPENPGVDPLTGQPIQPISLEIVGEVTREQELRRMAAVTPAPTTEPQVVYVHIPEATAEPVAEPIPTEAPAPEPQMVFRVFVEEDDLDLTHEHKLKGKAADDIRDPAGRLLIKKGKKLDLEIAEVQPVTARTYYLALQIAHPDLPGIAKASEEFVVQQPTHSENPQRRGISVRHIGIRLGRRVNIRQDFFGEHASEGPQAHYNSQYLTFSIASL